MTKHVSLFFIIALLGAGCAQPATKSPPVNTNQESASNNQTMKTYPPPTVLPKEGRLNKKARIKTAKGEIVFELLGDEAPLTVSNFITLTKDGFYDGVTFHRVVPGFVVQGGDPTGTGMGDPGYKFKDEPLKRSYAPGIVAMANSGPDTNGSQFFIVLPGGEKGLGPLYNIFGKVTSGMDVVEKIAVGDVMEQVTIEDAK